MEIEFYGAAGEVTGSCHVLRHSGRSFLIDCGMVQGGRGATTRNREDFPFNPEELDAVFLTHAHIDHSGRLPLLVQRGELGRKIGCAFSQLVSFAGDSSDFVG